MYFIVLLGIEPGPCTHSAGRALPLSSNSALWDEIILSQAGQFLASRTALIPIQMFSVIVRKCREPRQFLYSVAALAIPILSCSPSQ